MNSLIIAQVILAARNGDADDRGWMQLVVLVILALIYGVGSILKAKASKMAEEGEKESAAKPRGKPPGAVGPRFSKQLVDRQARGGPVSTARRPSRVPAQLQPRKVKRPEPAAAKAVAKTEAIREFPAMELPEMLTLAPETLELRPKPHELPELAKYASALLSDYGDPEKLRRAILHYEILGKPLSLRDPSEHIIGL